MRHGENEVRLQGLHNTGYMGRMTGVTWLRAESNFNKVSRSSNALLIAIDGHVCWNSNCQLPLVICRLRKTNFRFPFSANKWKLVVSVFRFPFAANKRKFQTENGSPGNFLNPFTVCSPCKRNFVVCPFADENTNRSYPLANGLHGINGINESAHLANSYTIHPDYFTYMYC